MPEDPEYGRRRFFKESVLSFARTAREYVHHRDAAPEKKPVEAPRTDWLRPPGAVDEALFLERCTRCGDCVEACPHDSITLGRRDGTPEIYPDQVPCYLCDDVPCAAACGTDALVPPRAREDVAMGVARVSHRVCTAGQGCHACVSQCPTNALAMDFASFRLTVAEERCVGCGLCEATCKTVNDKIAIRVVPARLLDVSGSGTSDGRAKTGT